MINNFFGNHYVSIINQNKTTLLQGIAAIKAMLTEVKNDFSQLLVEENTRANTETKIHILFKLLHSITLYNRESNDFLTFIQNNQQSIDFLISNANANEQAVWNTRLQQLSTPNLKQQGLSAVGYIATPFTTLYQKLAPSVVQNIADQLLPTFNSETRDWVQDLAIAQLNKLRDTSLIAQQATQQLKHKLIHEQGFLQEKATTLSEKNIKIILKGIAEAHKMLCGYEPLIARMAKQQQNLVQLQGMHTQIDQFLAIHDKWWVKLFQWLSQVFSLFKTETVIRVAHVKEMKGSANKLQLQYEQEINDGIEDIQNNPALSNQMKDAFMNKLIPQSENDNITPAPIPSLKEDIKRDYRHINTLFNKVNSPISLGEVDLRPEVRLSLP